MLKYLTAGESHGEFLTGILDGLPYGLEIDSAYVRNLLCRRRTALGRSERQKLENDDVLITGGLSAGKTTGAPISVLIKNSVHSIPAPSSVPRPAHADYAAMVKYSMQNAALVRERASARETAARLALFAFPKCLCENLGIKFYSEITELGGKKIPKNKSDKEKFIKKTLQLAVQKEDTLGGKFRLSVLGLPIGLGSYSQGFNRLSSALFAELAAIPSLKNICCGSENLCSMYGTKQAKDISVLGGLCGGITDGNTLFLTCGVKPVPGTVKAVCSKNIITGKKTEISSKSSDITSVFSAAVISEGAAAFVIANALLQKFGGDSFNEIAERVAEWRKKTEY